jgi:uncharacterized membrane protein
MMIVSPVKGFHVQGDPGIHGERLEPLPHQFGIERADLIVAERDPEHQERPSRDVDGDAGERFVHGHVNVRVPVQTLHVAERLLHRLPEGDSNIFGRVVMVDVEIAGGLGVDVDPGMAGQQVKHVIEESDAGRDRGGAPAVEIDRDGNVGFRGGAFDRSLAHVASLRDEVANLVSTDGALIHRRGVVNRTGRTDGTADGGGATQTSPLWDQKTTPTMSFARSGDAEPPNRRPAVEQTVNELVTFEAIASHWVRLAGVVIDVFGVIIIVVGIMWSTTAFLNTSPLDGRYDRYRVRIGRSLLLGLEILVAADIIKTVALEPTFTSLGVLAGLVLVRTFVSWNMVLEIEGRWPWRLKDDPQTRGIEPPPPSA